MLRPGDVLLLQGDLGAGKTTLVRGIAEACGVTTQVRSPTFALMHRYHGNPDLVHLDLYREKDPRGMEDFAGQAGAPDVVTVVEWPERGADYLWPGAPVVTLEHVDEKTRRIRLPDRLDPAARGFLALLVLLLLGFLVLAGEVVQVTLPR